MEVENQKIEAKRKQLHELIDRLENDDDINIALEKLTKITQFFN